MTIDVAVWYRVSGDSQTSENQVPDVERFVSHHGHNVTRTYKISDSAWKQGPEYRAAIEQMLTDAHQGHFKILVVWALDRIVRNGSEPGMTAGEEALRLIRHLSNRGVALVSIKESWLTASPEVAGILIPFAAWMGDMESKRRSERVKIGQARARAEGKHMGRPKGSADARPRKTSGYYRREAEKRERRA